MKKMYKVVAELNTGKYKVLELNEPITEAYTGFLIDGKKYNSVPIYDMPNNIAIEGDGTFLHKEVELIQMR